MRALLFVLASILATSPLPAQQPCPAAQHDATTVAPLRTTLRSIKLSEDDPGDSVPSLAQEKIPDLKSALAQTARDVLVCNPTTTSPATIESELSTLLRANPPQPPPGSSVMNGDKHYAEAISFDYSATLLVAVTHLGPGLLAVTFSFHIPCGDDNLLILFEPDHDRWRERLLWQSPPYKEISGAFGDIFDSVILPATAQSPWRLVTAHGRPWCASRFSGFAIDVLEPTADLAHPRTVWHTDRGYSRGGDAGETLKASGNIFEFRINADAMEFDAGTAFERRVIYRYRVIDDRVERIEPIALNARGFVEEWLSMPWSEAAAQTIDPTSPSLQAVHNAFENNRASTGNTFVQTSYGPVLACKPLREFQVQLKAERETMVPNKPGGDSAPMPSTFYQVRDTGNGYKLLSASAAADPHCTGPNLMHDQE
jgi:hypothetical protein